MFSSLYPLARASLFKMDAEDAHHLTLRALGAAGRTGLACALSARVPDAPRTVMGLTFRNPVGLAAGLDKDGAAIDGLAALGFG
ncbi:quinone-dependent dihydroorotate dehydrogenase, partial [Burkholderia cenocepacia]|nr:quinone-dependent dihydroorotate dehydrogenase [Burkholderia cenocepacia]